MTDGGGEQGVDAGQRREGERSNSAWFGSLIQPHVYPEKSLHTEVSCSTHSIPHFLSFL